MHMPDLKYLIKLDMMCHCHMFEQYTTRPNGLCYRRANVLKSSKHGLIDYKRLQHLPQALWIVLSGSRSYQ